MASIQEALRGEAPDRAQNDRKIPISSGWLSKVAFARQAYNDAVMGYNTSRETFPNVLIADSMGFKQAALFEVKEEAVREAPKVSF